MPSEEQINIGKQKLKSVYLQYLTEEELAVDYQELLSTYTIAFAENLEETARLEEAHKEFIKNQSFLGRFANNFIRSEEYNNYELNVKKLKNSLEHLTLEFDQKIKEQYAKTLSENIIKSVDLKDEELKKALQSIVLSETKYLESKEYFNLKIELLTYFYTTKKGEIDNKELPIEIIAQDLDSLYYELIVDNQKQAADLIYNIPGIHMLTKETISKFVKELFCKYCENSLNKLRNQNDISNSNINDFLRAIDLAIQEAANNYTIPEEDLNKIQFIKNPSVWKIWGENDHENNRIQAIIKAKATFANIKGTNFLSIEQQNAFINKLTILEQKEQIGQSQQYRFMKYLRPYQESDKKKCIEQIKESIQDSLTQYPALIKIKKEIEEQIEIELINDDKLKQKFEENILFEIIKYFQNNEESSSSNSSNLEKIFSQIEIAKLLCKIENFKRLQVPEQIKKINEINNILYQIKSRRGEAPADQVITNTDYDNLKNIIYDVATDAFIDEHAKKLLGVNDGFLPSVYETIHGFLDIGMWKKTVEDAALQEISNIIPSPVKPIISIFRPFSYLFEEIADIYKKPKSYVDKAFRIAAGITSGAVMIAGVSTIISLATNPISLPIIAAAGLGIIATVPIIAGSMKIAKMVSQKVAKYFYGIADPDLYIPSKKAIDLLGGIEQANEVADFFKKELIQINNKIDALPKVEQDQNIAKKLNNQLNILSKVWDEIQKGNTDNWKKLSKNLYMYAKNEAHNQLKNIDTNDMIYSLIDLTVPKAIINDDENIFSREAGAKMIGPKRNLVSFIKQNKLNKENKEQIIKLATINAIIKNSNQQ